MGRKRLGDAVGTSLIAILALGAWVISEYGVMLLIFGALAAACRFSEFVRRRVLPSFDQESPRSSSISPRVSMMKPSGSRRFDDFRRRRSAMFNGSAPWRIPKTSVDAILVVVRSVFPEQATQMEFVEYHNEIQQLAADRSHPSLCNPVLPWATQ